MADTMTTGHGHDERNGDHGAAPSYVVPNSWKHARRRLAPTSSVCSSWAAAARAKPPARICSKL